MELRATKLSHGKSGRQHDRKDLVSNRPQNFSSTSAYDEYTGIDPYNPEYANSYVKTELTSIRDASGNYSKTAIKDYNYDKNGNVTRVAEYDWVDYASVSRGGPFALPTGIPANAVLKRVTTNTLARWTPDASDSSSSVADSYWNGTAPSLRNAIASSEVGNGSTTLTRSEFVYDDAATTGNLTQQKSWDSTKGAYSNPLSGANSISVSHQYDTYGNPTLSTDALGNQTQIVYGSVAGFTALYPTQVKTAYQTSVQRTETLEYDFSTGLVTRTTDIDNNVSNSTTYDIFGRSTLVKATEGKPEETRTSTSYSDVDRRVIVKSDLNMVGDEKLVKIQHYDQLGRVRLSRQLEDATTQNATDETTGIKVQTRYQYSGNFSYVLSSNPYRAATSAAAGSEATMGWSRSKSNNSGRVIEVQTFAGATPPAPWGTNTSGTGRVTNAYDANFTTVTDQAGKVRRSMTDGLGRLIRVDEPDVNGNLGTTNSPLQPTSYGYDAFANLLTVNQGVQTRSFAYSSLARLTSATNPESGTVSYEYDNNGNLTKKTDARPFFTTYTYDALNRNTSVNYSNTTIGNPDVPDITRFYDGATNGKGRFWYSYKAGNFSVGSNVEHSAVDSYDALGRPLVQRQLFKLNGSWGPTYQISRFYNRAGSVTYQTYPSGHTVSYSYDAAGRSSSVTGNLGDGTSRTYATNISYSPSGTLSREQFGTNTLLYHKLFYNSRGQLFDTRVSSVNDTWDWNRGRLILYYSSNHAWGQTGTDNNGNVRFAETWIPPENATLDQVDTLFEESYSYDSLNRLSSVAGQKMSVATGWGTWQQQFRQQYVYDRYGNGTIDAAQTWGTGINNKQFNVDTATNRLGVPSGQTGTMGYDAVGNLITDTYSGAGAREYDAENKLTLAWGGNNQWQEYTYNADGQRARRKVDGQETWQIYGMEGELLAEYAANGAPNIAQQEYGYRNGQLLVTASSSTIDWLVSDHLGTPRMIIDQTGSLANLKRHDYLPFGEELFAPSGGRTAGQGYATGNGVRQQFTQKERDIETGLDYFEARYYASTQGRFTSIDPYNIMMEKQYATDAKKAESQFTVYLSNPQRWARYTYALNNPLLYTDPHGEDVTIYYRPPDEGKGSTEDQGHILIYVRNDETGEAAYFDYIADSREASVTQLNQVTQDRLRAHASLTIETDSKQEQAILNGIKEMYNSAPDFNLKGLSGEGLKQVFWDKSESTCASNSIKLLALGGINVGATPQSPTNVWTSAVFKYGKSHVEDTGAERGRVWVRKYDGLGPLRMGAEYGRDPRGQARTLDTRALGTNQTINFRGGKRLN